MHLARLFHCAFKQATIMIVPGICMSYIFVATYIYSYIPGILAAFDVTIVLLYKILVYNIIL